jgi:ribosomal protein S26
MTIQIDAVYVQCDECGESCAMNHSIITTEPKDIKQSVLDYIKSGFDFYDLDEWKVITRSSKKYCYGCNIICGDCLKKLKEVA